MKSSRLLSMLLLLQAHGRMTSAELAERLEVSRRTILRDVTALSAAGVPVYTERGRHGAIVLMSESRLNAAHLDAAELEALLVAGLDRHVVAALDLAAAAESSALKLAARHAPRTRGRNLAEVIVVESAPWASDDQPPDVIALARTVLAERRLRVAYRRSGEASAEEVLVDPYGLAVKAGRWYLVADNDGSPRLFTLTRMTAHEMTDSPVRRRAGETLSSVWAALREAAEPGGRLFVTARLRADRVDLARRILGARLVRVGNAQETDPQGRVEMVVRHDHPEAVRQLLQFGDHIEVVSPASARKRMRELAVELARAHEAQR